MLSIHPSPIHNLPPELISIIIQGGIRQDTITLPPASAANDVVRLSQICRRWKDIVLHGQPLDQYDIDLPRGWMRQYFPSPPLPPRPARPVRFARWPGTPSFFFIRQGRANAARDALMQVLLTHSGRMTSLELRLD
ncbi:hypothetical protein C8R44DRAFT_165400 [Mycena epipterygia]|nr:hypothetical protein C8R44DRAFT_165400 [Mycena epipterygia]